MSNKDWNARLLRATPFPCRDCTKRHEKCHGDCRIYQCYKAMNKILAQRRAEYLMEYGDRVAQDLKSTNTISDKKGRNRQ